MLKYWDLDRFEMLLELPGHHSEVWALALSTYGDFCLTGAEEGAGIIRGSFDQYRVRGCVLLRMHAGLVTTAL